MTRIAKRMAVATILLIAAAVPAWAGDLPPGGMTAQDVATWLLSKGYSAQIKPDSTTPGDQIISSSVDGINFDIYMYFCTSGRCKSLQYAAGWQPRADFNADKVNQWDRGYRYIRGYVADDGGLWAEYDLDVYPGGTYEALNASLDRWRSALGEFKTFFGG